VLGLAGKLVGDREIVSLTLPMYSDQQCKHETLPILCLSSSSDSSGNRVEYLVFLQVLLLQAATARLGRTSVPAAICSKYDKRATQLLQNKTRAG
jgi:hypothetical protein